MTITYHYTRNKTPLSQVINENILFYSEDVPFFCNCNKYIRWSQNRKIWMEIKTDGKTIVKENHTCKFIPATESIVKNE